jgi:phenylalanyl-tRNA synthetase beta chain
VAVTNPLSSQHALLRQSLIGSLLDVVRANVRQGQDDVAIFEIGKGYARDGASSREWWRLGIALTGEAAPVHWNRPARHVDLDDLKGIVELVGSRLGLGHATYVPLTDDPVFHPGRSARIELRDRRGELGLSGRIGEVDPRILDAWDVRAKRVVAAEVALAGLSGGGLPAVRATPVSRQPAVHRDLAVVVDESMPAGDVERAIRRAGGDLLQRLTLFDIYRGAPLAATDKSLAFRLLFQASGRTLTEDEVEAIVARVTERLATDVGGRLRT